MFVSDTTFCAAKLPPPNKGRNLSLFSLSLSLSSAFTQQLFAAGGKALFEKAQEACVMSPSDVANIRAIMREQQKEDVEEDGEGGKQKMRTEVMQTILGG